MAYTTINKSTDYFNTKLYTGDGASSNAITGVGFQPDWNWHKIRNDTDWHMVNDAVRGANYAIYPNATNAQGNVPTGLKSFDSDGFTVGNLNDSNQNNGNFVSWNWKANGAGSANTDGSISSTVSVNTTSGFSIVSYTGTGSAGTVGHGLGSTPKMIIFKDRSNDNGWHTYHSSFANATDLLLLDTSGSLYTSNNYINNTRPTSSVFSLGNTGGTNGSSANYIAYCFNDVQGYSKIGSYKGNGNADGTFVYTGFKPAWVIQKPTNVTQNWQIHDTKRDGYNPKNDNLSSNSTSAESDNKFIDIVSNGFKLRRSDVLNVSGDNYIYMAFAEAPLVGSNGVTAKAR